MKATNFKKLSYLMAGSISLSILSGCGGTNGNANGGNSTLGETLPTVEKVKKVYFDEVGIVPLDAGNAQFALRLNNSYDERFTLDDIYAVDPVTHTRNNSLASISKGNCAQVPSNNYCTVNYSSKLNKNGAFIVEAQLTNTKTGKKLVQRQFVRVGHLNDLNGLEFRAELDEVPAINKHFSMALPVYVKGDFKELKAKDGLKGKLLCAGEATKGGTACTYLVDGDVLAGKTSVQTRIEGISKNGKTVNLSSNTVVNTNREGHLLISLPNDVDMNKLTATNNSHMVTVFNNGTNNVEEIKPSASVTGLSSGITIDTTSGATDLCSTTPLLSGDSCQVRYTLDKNIITKNSIGNINVDYNKIKNDEKDPELARVPASFLMTWASISNPGNIIDPSTGKPVIDPATQCKPPLGTGTIDCETSGTVNQNMVLRVNGSPNDLNASPAGRDREVIYTVKNDSLRPIKDIEIGVYRFPSTTNFTLIPETGADKCNVAAKFDLASGASCTFKANLNAQDGAIGYNQIIATGEYDDAVNSGTLPVSGFVVTNFSASDLFKLFTLTPARSLFQVPVGSSNTQEYTLANTSGVPFKHGKIELTPGAHNLAAAILNSDQLKLETSTASGGSAACDLAAGTEIAATKDCKFNVTYTPTRTTSFSAVPFELNVPITEIDSKNSLSNNLKIVANVDAYAGQRANITGRLALLTPALSATHFYIPGETPHQYDYVFTNTGGEAKRFNVATNNLPLGMRVLNNVVADKDVDGTGPIKACPIGITFGDLATNESCYISMNAPDVSFFNSGLLDENLPLEFAGEVNYDDSELGFVVSNDSSKLLPFDQFVSGNWVNINVSNVTDTIGEETFNVNGTPVTANLRKVELTVELDGIKANIANLGNLEVLPVVGISGIAAPVAAPIAKVDGATARVTAYLPISTTSQVIELKLINKANGSVVRSVKHTLSNFTSTVRAQ
ncbi:MAG: hypothetical protein E6Q33_07520 [Neisseriales bacterium]|nr:MAG: hypothetical protein E6Q33_07520 [Neisseriales bacterium]